MKIETEGQCFVLSGAFDLSGNKRALVARLEAAGATVKNTTSSLTTAVVIGRSQWPTNAEEFARQRGLPVLTEAQALELLERGTLELEDAAEPDAPLDELIGEARAVLDGEPDARAWDALTGLLDRCSLERQAALVDYLRGPLDHWSIPQSAKYTPPKDSDYYIGQWAESAPLGVLRVAPRSWISEALQGEVQPKYSLARAVMFTRMKLTNKDVIAVIGSGAFTNASALDVGEHQAKRSGAVFTAVAQSPMAANLTDLRLESFLGTHARALSHDSPLRLKRLRLNASTNTYDEAAVASLCCSAWVEELEELHLESRYSYQRGAPRIEALRNLPELSRVVIEPRAGLGMLMGVLETLPATETLALVGKIYGDQGDLTRALLERPASGFGTLDVSELETYYEKVSVDGEDVTLQEHLFDRLPGSRMCEGLERVRLGPWRTDALAQAFEARGIAVE